MSIPFSHLAAEASKAHDSVENVDTWEHVLVVAAYIAVQVGRHLAPSVTLLVKTWIRTKVRGLRGENPHRKEGKHRQTRGAHIDSIRGAPHTKGERSDAESGRSPEG